MANEIGIGVSTKLDSFTAGKEAARTALYHLESHYSPPDIAIIFVSTIYNSPDVIKGIRSVIKESPLVGCSSIGSITPLGSFKNAVAVCVIKSRSIVFSCGLGNNISKAPRLAGSDAARLCSQALKDAKRQLYVMFCDGFHGNSLDILRGTQEILGTSFPVIGGAAIDDLQFKNSYQYLSNNIYTDSIVGLLIGGNITVGIGNYHGWQPIGKPHTITRAKANFIKEIDGKVAIELYEKYLDKTIDELTKEGIAKIGISYPLGINVKKDKEYLVMAPLKIGERGSLMLSEEISERQNVSLMIGDKNLALLATRHSCHEALKNAKTGHIKFAFVFSDIARLQLLRRDSNAEVEIIRESLGKDVPFFGCYTYGEYAPAESEEYSGQSYFHSQAISIAVVSE